MKLETLRILADDRNFKKYLLEKALKELGACVVYHSETLLRG